jgi:CubicO group peptidase (beta-lactamase class C family)
MLGGKIWCSGIVVVCVLAAACSSGDDDAGEPAEDDTTTTTVAEHTYPGDEWATVDRSDAGFDAAGLTRLADTAAAANSTCLVVTRGGELVDEHYWRDMTPDSPREAFSVTKSITSTLVGIAQDQGLLDIAEPAADYIPEWSGTDAAAVSVENLLSNNSGRHWDLNTDYVRMAIGAPDKTAFAVGLAQDTAPGEVWAYNNSAIQTLSAVLEAATGADPVDFARTQIFEPLGMRHSALGTDAAGNALTYAGLQTTCRDLARFGYLMLRDGVWDGEQVVSSEYVAQATGESSTPLNAAYGWLWWLNHKGPIGSPTLATTGVEDAPIADGQLVPGAPDDVFWALGFNNQIVAVIPSEDIVAVRMGPRPPTEAPFTQAELTLGVLDALTAP